MSTVYTVMIEYGFKNRIEKVSYSFLSYSDMSKAVEVLRDARDNPNSNIVRCKWNFSASVRSLGDMLSYIENTTDIYGIEGE